MDKELRFRVSTQGDIILRSLSSRIGGACAAVILAALAYASFGPTDSPAPDEPSGGWKLALSVCFAFVSIAAYYVFSRTSVRVWSNFFEVYNPVHLHVIPYEHVEALDIGSMGIPSMTVAGHGRIRLWGLSVSSVDSALGDSDETAILRHLVLAKERTQLKPLDAGGGGTRVRRALDPVGLVLVAYWTVFVVWLTVALHA